MFSKTDIVAKSWMIQEVVNLVLQKDKLSVKKMFLIGSYASGKEDPFSDLDILVELQKEGSNGIFYPLWSQIQEIHNRLDNPRIHVVFGTEEAAKSLHEKHKHEKKNYKYKEIDLQTVSTHVYS